MVTRKDMELTVVKVILGNGHHVGGETLAM